MSTVTLLIFIILFFFIGKDIVTGSAKFNYSPVFLLPSPHFLQFMLPTVEELSENVEIEGKGTHDNGSRARSTAALGVFGVQSCAGWDGVGRGAKRHLLTHQTRL